MKSNVLIVLPKLTSPGGVSSFWNALLPEFFKFKDVNTKTFEIGGHGKNILGPLIDQWFFKKAISTEVDLVVLNPSLGLRSFYRDGLFAKRLKKRNIPFAVFFHGWNIEFEKKVTDKHIGFFKNSFGSARIIFVLSNDFKNKIIQWGYKGEIVIETTTVNKALLNNYDYWEKVNQDKQNRKIRILFLSRLLKEKGIYETIDAFIKLSERHTNLELTITGSGVEYEKIEKLVRKQTSIKMTGHLEGQEKSDIFKGSQIYCLPSYSEGLPTTVLEAMAFGLPVVTTAVGGLKNFFQNGKMGYLIEPGSSEQLLEKLELLLADRSQMANMGMYNFNYANENVLSTEVAKRLFNRLKSLSHD